MRHESRGLATAKEKSDGGKISARSGNLDSARLAGKPACRKISIPFYRPRPQSTKPYENVEKMNLTI